MSKGGGVGCSGLEGAGRVGGGGGGGAGRVVCEENRREAGPENDIYKGGRGSLTHGGASYLHSIEMICAVRRGQLIAGACS